MPGGFEQLSSSSDSPSGQEEPDAEPEQPEQQVRFEDLQQEFQEIEEKLTSEAFDIPAEDRVKLVHRILEHSLDDGLRFAKKLGISKENLRKGMLRPSFAIKHPELTDQLAEYLDASREGDYMHDRNKGKVDEFVALSKQVRGEVENILESKDYPELLADEDDSLRLRSDQAKELKESIDGYYTHFLQARSVEEKEIPVDPRTEGVEKAEETLKKAREILKEQYYPQGVFGVLGKALGGDLADAQPSKREEFIKDHAKISERATKRFAYSQRLDKEDLEALLAVIRVHEGEDIFDKDDMLKKLEKHRAKPIKQSYEVPKQDAVRTLKKELKQNITRRGFDKEDVRVYEDEERNEFVVEIEGEKIRQTEKQEKFELNLDNFEKTTIDISEWFEQGYGQTVPSGENGVTIGKGEEERFVFPDGTVSDPYSSIDSVITEGNNYYLKVELQSADEVDFDDRPRAIITKDGTKIFEHNGRIEIKKGKIKGKGEQVVYKYAEEETHILKTIDGKEIDRAENINTRKREGGIFYKKSTESGGKVVYPDGTETKQFDNLRHFDVTEDGSVFFTTFEDTKEIDTYKGKKEVNTDSFIHTPEGKKVGPFDGISSFSVQETEYGPIIEIRTEYRTENKYHTEILRPDGELLAREPYDSIIKKKMTERGLAYLAVAEGDKQKIHYPDGRKRVVEEALIFEKVDGEIVARIREHDGGKRSLLYEDGQKSELYENIGSIREFEQNPIYVATERSDLKDEGWDRDDYVVVESRDLKLGPFNSIIDIKEIDDSFYFIAQRELNGTRSIYNGKGERVSPQFDELRDYSRSDDRMYLKGLRDGKYEVYQKGFSEGSEEVELSKREKKKLKLLNMLADEELDEIDQYFQEKAKGGEKNWKESMKDLLSRSDVIGGTMNAAQKKNPQAFLETARAKQDNLSWEKMKEIAHEMFPEIEWKRDEKTASFSSPSAEDYLRDRDSMEYRDGDPKKEGKEVLTMREEVDDLIVSDVLGGYDPDSKRWHKVQFPNKLHLEEPVKENTFTIDDVGWMSSLRLPRSLGAKIIQDRIKGVTDEGQEIRLESTKTPLGEVTVEVPDEAEEVVYSQRKSELPMHMEGLTDKEFNDFRNGFEKQVGDELTEPLPGVPEDLKIFVRNDLEGLSVKEKVMAIEEKVRELGVYDDSNAEVMDAKEGASITERIRVMRNRADDLQDREGVGNAQYAGVCADFAVLTTALLREAGIPSGVLSGFRPEGKTVTTKEAHGTAFVVWPSDTGGYKVIPVDGTPGSSVGEEVVDFQEVSLEEQDREYEEETENLVEESKEQLDEMKEQFDEYGIEELRVLANGDLERELNKLLQHGVKENHVATIKRVLNASRYSPASIEKLDLTDSEDQETFRSFVESEIEKSKGRTESSKPAGAELMSVMQEFVRRYKRDYEHEKVFGMLERAIETIAESEKIDDIESQSALGVLEYLRAKEMRE